MTNNPFRRVNEWTNNVHAQAKIDKQEQDILKPYNMNIYIQKSELETADEAKIREELRARLGPFLKSNQVANAFIDYLDKNSDLTNFYQLEKPFMREIAGIRRIDLPYLTHLWTKYRNKVLETIERTIRKETPTGVATVPAPNETEIEEYKRLKQDLAYGAIPINKSGVAYPSKQKVQERLKQLKELIGYQPKITLFGKQTKPGEVTPTVLSGFVKK